ncbi:MAG: hypothetical protein RPR97_00380, partial [Colwellia sp.]
AQARYSEKHRQAFYPINFMKAVIEYLKADLVVATNSPRSERAIIDAAGIFGCASICIVDMFALQEVEWIGRTGFSKKVCVLNDSVKEMFIKEGRNSADIIVTGNPAFDSLQDKDKLMQGGEIRKKFNLKPGQLAILYASQPEPAKHPFNERIGDESLPRRIEAVLRAEAGQHDKYKLIVRYHPSETIEFEAGKNILSSPKSENLHALLHAVDIVVVAASTVGLEASLIGKNVISVDDSIFTLDAPFSQMGISTGVDCPSQLPAALDSLVYKNTRESLSELEDSTSKIIKVVDSLLNL